MDDKVGSTPRKPRDSSSVLPSELSGQDRFTVASIGEKIRSGKADFDYSTARSRKHRRKEESGSGIYLWLVIALIVFSYLGLMSYRIIKNRATPPRVKSQPAKPAPTPIKVAGELPETAPAADSENTTVVSTVTSAVPVLELIVAMRRAQQLSEEGRRLSRNRQFAQAETKFAEAAALAPNVFSILMELARVQSELKQSQACRDVLVRAVGIDPESVPARLMLAQVYYDLRQNDDALAMAQWVLESEPYSEAANQIAAEIYNVMERYDLAISHWQKISALNSSNAGVKNSLGSAQMKLGQIAQAISTFEGVLKIDPANSQAFYYLSICLIKKNEPELAVDILNRASTKLGLQFVQTWTQSPDFDSLRDLDSYKQLFPEVAPVAVIPVELD